MPNLSVNYSLARAFNEETLHLRIPALVFLSIALLFGLFGNAAVICIYGFRMRRTNVFFLINLLSFSDFISCLIVIPLEMYRVRIFYAYDTDSLCKLESYVLFSRFVNSTLLLLIISVERYVRVCYSKSRQMEFRTARKVGIASSVIAMFLAIPSWIWTVPALSLVDGHNISYRCAPYLDVRLFKYGRVVFLVSFMIWAMMLVLYILMLGTLKELVTWNVEESTGLRLQLKGPQKLSRTNRTVLCVTFAFVCTSGFYFSFLLVNMISKRQTAMDSIHYFLFLLNETWVINIMFNPFVLGFMNTDFRIELCKLLRIKYNDQISDNEAADGSSASVDKNVQ